MIADRPKASRQPTLVANRSSLSSASEASEPKIVPIQYEPPMMRSTAPRTRAGISSSTAEWIAEYSPPTPAPVMTRQTRNQAKFMLKAVRMLPARKTPSVIMNSRLRPRRSARRPKNNAPAHAPAMYAEPAAPTWVAVSSRPEPSSLSRPPIAPTIVTARPSRIQTVPSPMITIQCHLDHGNRSIRAGMSVSMVRNVTAASPLVLATGDPLLTETRPADFPGRRSLGTEEGLGADRGREI